MGATRGDHLTSPRVTLGHVQPPAAHSQVTPGHGQVTPRSLGRRDGHDRHQRGSPPISPLSASLSRSTTRRQRRPAASLGMCAAPEIAPPSAAPADQTPRRHRRDPSDICGGRQKLQFSRQPSGRSWCYSRSDGRVGRIAYIFLPSEKPNNKTNQTKANIT